MRLHTSTFLRSSIVLATVALGLSTAAAVADEVGRQEYMAYCASCHGETAMGDGEIARFLTVETPALTTLAQDNDGVFPMLEVIQIIDGRSGLGPHGTMMPVWGDRFKAAVEADTGEFGAEIIVRGRILSLATYLQSIQQ